MIRSLRYITALCCLLAASMSAISLAQEKPKSDTSESWDVIHIQGAKMGYGHTRVSVIVVGGQKLRKTDATAQMSIKRLGQKLDIEMSVHSVETIDGQVLRFQSKVAFGPTPTVVTGEYRDGSMHLTTKTLGKSIASKLPWKKDYRGFFFAEQTLENKPMKPGERRSFSGLVPVFNQVALTDLEAGEFEETKTLGGNRRLLKITSTTKLGAAKIKSFIWMNETGQTLKTLEPTMNQVSYRTTREVALREGSLAPDLLVGSIVKPSGKTSGINRANEVTYRVSVSDANAAELFPAGVSQSVKTITKDRAELTIRRVRVGGKALSKLDELAPTKKDREPSNWIQNDDPAIVKLAGQVAEGEKNAANVAVALEKHVNELITEKDFSTALATAAEVAKSRQGDCTEHAVLLAALARARGIPSRAVVGLVYVRPLNGFGYHMWTEVWLDGHWFPLDATRPQGGTGCGHIKIAHNNLSGADGSLVFLPVLQVMGKLKIEVVKITE